MRILWRLLDRLTRSRKSVLEATKGTEGPVCEANPNFGFGKSEAVVSSRKVQRPITSAERALTAQGFTIREYGGRGHQKSESERNKSWFYDELQPGLNGKCRILVQNGKPLNAAGQRLLDSYKSSAK